MRLTTLDLLIDRTKALGLPVTRVGVQGGMVILFSWIDITGVVEKCRDCRYEGRVVTYIAFQSFARRGKGGDRDTVPKYAGVYHCDVGRIGQARPICIGNIASDNVDAALRSANIELVISILLCQFGDKSPCDLFRYQDLLGRLLPRRSISGYHPYEDLGVMAAMVAMAPLA